MSATRRMLLLNWAVRTGAWIIEDDYDWEFRYAGQPLPALAQVAKQQGQYLAAALARPGEKAAPFRFNNRGNTAVIGRNAAVFDFGRFRIRGRFAWLLWALVHVYLLIGFENRLQVVTHWLWSYFTHERGARLIMQEGTEGAPSIPERRDQ